MSMATQEHPATDIQMHSSPDISQELISYILQVQKFKYIKYGIQNLAYLQVKFKKLTWDWI